MHPGSNITCLAKTLYQMLNVYTNLNKYIKAGYGSGGQGNKARVAIVDKEVRTQRLCSKIVYAACAVGDVAQDTKRARGAKFSQDISDSTGIHE
mmetsp:Transcript_22776/g.33358  ORF Transcript_22776/g.33358 Transcript_22776/m.33358 type:complete len:94 (-) Transcript_22776:24-305(-)